jgi:hypothetical protein
VQTIRVTVDSGAAIGHGCYAILFVDNPPPPRTAQSTAVQYSVRYGVKVYVEPETPLSAEVTDVGVSETKANIASGKLSAQAGGRARQLDITYKNTGARQTMAHGAVEIRRPDNSVVSDRHTRVPPLPGATRPSVSRFQLPSRRCCCLTSSITRGRDRRRARWNWISRDLRAARRAAILGCGLAAIGARVSALGAQTTLTVTGGSMTTFAQPGLSDYIACSLTDGPTITFSVSLSGAFGQKPHGLRRDLRNDRHAGQRKAISS